MSSPNPKAKKTNKRLRSKYSWVKGEFEYMEECCAEGDREMRSSDLWRRFMESQGIYSGYGPAPEEEPEAGGPLSKDVLNDADLFETPEGLEAEEEHATTAEKRKDPNAKKLFRKLIDKTHPDKTQNNDHVEDFFKAREAYNNNNIAELVALCMKHDIDVPEYLLEAENQSLESTIASLQHQIKTKQGTLAYMWYMAENDEQKQRLLDLVMEQYGQQS
tara:strand:- start:1650 stop:2303 length:654 start_codon:yes stop_codon:yes gene_type:complete